MSDEPFYAPVVRELWRTLDRLDEAGFSLNPFDVAQNVKAAIALLDLVRRIATQRPPGDPADSRRAADAWRALERALVDAAGDVADERSRRRDIWRGSAANAFDATVRTLDDRLTEAAVGARRACVALETHASALAAAQRRHDDVGGSLARARDDVAQMPPQLDDLVRHLREAVQAALDSWRAAGAAADACEAELAAVEAAMPFPDGTAPGMRALDQVGQHAPGAGRRPLVGDVLEDARMHYDGLSEADRAAFDALMDAAPSERHRAWLLATLAAGHPVDVVSRFAQHIAQAPDPDALLDPSPYLYPQAGSSYSDLRALGEDAVPFRQSTGTTCGSSSLVYARLLHDPVAALQVIDGYDATTGETHPGTRAERFREHEAAMKARTDDPRLYPDREDSPRSVPWVPALGTAPWHAAEELTIMSGQEYGVHLVDQDSPQDAADAYRRVVETTGRGEPVALYIGDEASPRHVVLVYGHGDGTLEVYDPGYGVRTTITYDQLVSGEFSVAGWEQPWAVIAP